MPIVSFQWAHGVLQSCPSSLSDSLGGPLAFLRLAVDELANAYKAPIHPLLPRPALFLFCHVASSLYLLEHAVWAVNGGEPESQTDVEVFRRWVLEGGLSTAIENVRRTKNGQRDRIQSDTAIVYGRAAAKL